MAKQLLILMGLLVSRSPNQQIEPATDELKVASFECMATIISQRASTASSFVREANGTNVVDQLVYQLLEALTDTSSEHVQLSAAHALLELVRAVKNRTLLASLLPRSVSTLVKVLRPSTQAKRTRHVLVIYLNLLEDLLRSVLSDELVSKELTSKSPDRQRPEHGIILDKSWLDATTAQIDLALVQVVKLRTHESPDVAAALLSLCLMVVNDCSQTLKSSMPLMVETLAVLCKTSHSPKAYAALKHLLTSRPEIADILSARLYDWSNALPRVMQGNDDRPKQQLLGQVATSFIVLTDTAHIPSEEMSRIASVLIDAVAAAIGTTSKKRKMVSETAKIPPGDLVLPSNPGEREFVPLILAHQSQTSSTEELKQLIVSLRAQPFNQNITRTLVDHIFDPDADRRLSAVWLALQFLKPDGSQPFDMTELFEDESSSSDLSVSRPFLISDLYSHTLPFLTEYSDPTGEENQDWQLVALSLETLVLQASQLGRSYRHELMETLFPLLTLLSSNNAPLQQNAMTALNLLATACQYDSAAHMLIENVDYLINAVALRLNAFDVSRNSLQVITMMIRLCGARIVPHLDDLIGSIFGALDSFHGYPGLVEQLFEVLKRVVKETSTSPTVLAIDASEHPSIRKDATPHVSALQDIINDLQARKRRKTQFAQEDALVSATPHRPWTTAKDGLPGATQENSTNMDVDDDEDDAQPLEHTAKKDEAKVSKSHQLLLNIAQSTVPHMASPSAKVRLTLLELLQDICPILANHENTFLPLVNSIWPAVVSRLLNKGDETSADLAYNVRAAAVTIAAICRAAGNFMSSRIEEIFSDLEAVFKKTYSSLTQSTKHQKSVVPGTVIVAPSQLARPITDATTATSVSALQHASGSGDSVRTSDGQVMQSLVILMVTILRNVRVTEDNADKIFDLLGPFRHTASVQEALLGYNEDAVWVQDHSSNP